MTSRPSGLPSTRKHEIPFSPRAKTRIVPPKLPLVIHCFVPVSRQPSPSRSAFVRSERASEPEPDSVSANAPIFSPRASGGTSVWACSSVPNLAIGSVHADVWTATVTPIPASAREISSSTSMYETKSAPTPPSSSGMQTPMSPSSASFGTSSCGKRCSVSHAVA